jgi:hypothetical protein
MSKKELKIELKKLTKEIRETKTKLKEYQRTNAGYDGGFYHTIEMLRYEFRHKHIELRGRKYEEIEIHCSDKHIPNFVYIKEIMDEHQQKAVEDVRACA